MSRINMNAVIVGNVLLMIAIAICDAGENSGRKEYVIQAKKANWSEAMRQCRKRKMEVVSIKSKQENEEFIRKIAGTGWKNVWTSGRDVYKKGHFQWVPIHQEFTYENWLDGQASRGFDEETMEEAFCVEILLANNRGKWHDDLCSAEKNFVCEKYQQPRRPPPVTERKPIEKPTVRQRKKVYTVYNAAYNEKNARRWCAEKKGSLATITSPEDFEEISRVMSGLKWTFDHGAWINNQFEPGKRCMQVVYRSVKRQMTQIYEPCENPAHIVCEYDQ